MILLPDIELMINGQRHLLSIQEPFTLDGYLITDININEIEFSCDTYPRGSIAIKNEDNYYIEIYVDEISSHFNRKMSNFIARYGHNAHVEGRRDVDNWNNYNFNTYIREIQIQCDRIRDARHYSFDYSNSNYLNHLRNELGIQGRYRIRYDYFYDNPFAYSVNDINDAMRRLANLNTWSNPTNGFLNINNYKYIHKHNYKPEYVPHYMSDEDKDTTLLLGCEIEVAGNEKEPNRENVVKKCIQIINGSEDDSEDLIYSTSDSTVQIELDTMPCSLEFHKNKMNYKEMFKYLDELGYKGHDCDKAGLHIHACRSYLGKSELIQQLTISKILYIIEKFNDEICVIARRNNDYCKFVGKEEVNQSLDKLYGKYKDNGKKVALNLQHKDTIEFRMFKSTLKYETFILTLEFVKDIIDFAKSINIEEIELIKWSDLMDVFSDELKEYYNERLEKENKKKENNNEEKKESFTCAYTLNNSSLLSNNGDIILTLDSIPSLSLEYDSIEPMMANQMRSLIDSSIEGTLSANISIDRDTSNRTLYDLFYGEINNRVQSNKSKEEKLKDKIKSLKKQIKNNNNFMEKKNLKKELNEAQKELKKEKKKKKLNNNT